MERLTVRLSDRESQILDFLYKKYNITADNNSERFRNLLDSLNSHISNLEEQLERTAQTLVELPKCQNVPTLVTRGTHSGMVYCPSPKTVGLRKGNHVQLEVCNNCFKRQETSREREGIPTEKTELAPRYEPKQPVKQRKCIDCGKDISELENWKIRCSFCYKKFMNPNWQGEGKPLAGSPEAIRKKDAARIRRANARLSNKTREKE